MRASVGPILPPAPSTIDVARTGGERRFRLGPRRGERVVELGFGHLLFGASFHGRPLRVALDAYDHRVESDLAPG